MGEAISGLPRGEATCIAFFSHSPPPGLQNSPYNLSSQPMATQGLVFLHQSLVIALLGLNQDF